MSAQLRSPQSAAERLGVSVKTLNGYVRDGELRYINVGRGRKKQRRKFTDEDLDELIERRTRRDVPCQSTSTKTAPSTISTSSTRVLAFTALRDAQAGARPKPSSEPNATERNNS
ncbi:helix-turn-helix domain-containing protein [Bradyrhizobium barranii]|uniref:helix-turn-helix domain-containing protein n=1 Tax=Bradyrhizobium barranii TaxID=2992140 RepID=UPI001CD69A53